MFKTSTPLFRLLGFEVKVDISWLLLAFLITWTLAVGLFPTTYPGLSTDTYWWMGLVCAIGVFFSIVLHELSHSVVARYYNIQITGITMFIFGGVAEMQSEPPDPKSEFLMAMAGPIASFVLAFIFYQIYSLAVVQTLPIPVIGVALYLTYINTLVAIFNLIPAFPLDGGRMLRAILWHIKKDLKKATYISSRIGSGFAIALIILGIVAIIQGNLIGGMWWILIGFFLRNAATSSYQQLVVQELLRDQPISQFMISNPVTVTPDITIQQLVDRYFYLYHHKLFPVVDNEQLVGCVTLDTVKKIPQNQWPQTTIAMLKLNCSSEYILAPDDSTLEILPRMFEKNREAAYMVVDKGRLVGILELKDLWQFIAIKLELESSKKT